MDKLKDLINGPDLIVAPCALNPIMAQMAAEAGFKAAYLSGGSLGWYKGVTEAGLSLTEMIQVVVDSKGARRDVAYVSEEARTFYLKVDSANVDWKVIVDEGFSATVEPKH